MIQFEQQTITIQDRDRQPRILSAMVGLTIGIAYCQDPLEESPRFDLSHVASGLLMHSGEWSVTTPEQAQAWIKLVARLSDWTASSKELLQAAPADLAERVKLARYSIAGTASWSPSKAACTTEDEEEDDEARQEAS